MEYKVIVEGLLGAEGKTNKKVFEDDVTDHLNRGYELYGNIVLYDPEYGRLIQVMIRKD